MAICAFGEKLLQKSTGIYVVSGYTRSLKLCRYFCSTSPQCQRAPRLQSFRTV